MSFFAPVLLFGLFAALLPVLIHLLNRRRHRTIQWAAMQFLLKATQESRGAKKLKHFLILLMRALAVAGLVFVIARPVMSGLLGWGGGSIDTVVLLLDRSASMELREGQSQSSKREFILQRIASSMNELPEADLVLIDSATLTAQDVPSPEVLPELLGTAPTATASNIPALITAGLDYIQEGQPGRTELWLASDQQRASWSPDDGRWDAIAATYDTLENVSLRVLNLKAPPANNVSLQLRNARRVGPELQLTLELARRESRGPITLPVTYSLNGTELAETITLEGQSLIFQKRFDLSNRTGPGFGSAQISGDPNTSDNQIFFTYPADQPVRTLIVTEDLELRRPLEFMAAPPEFGNFQTETVSPVSFASANLQNVATILWQSTLPTDESATALESFIREGGTALFFPSAQDDETEFLQLQWSTLEQAPRDQFFIVAEWNRDDGPLADGVDSTALPVDRVRAVQRRQFAGDLRNLALWDDGAALIGRRIIDQGAVYFVSTLPLYEWSNLADGDVLLPALQRIIQDGSDRLSGQGSLAAGSEMTKAFPGEVVTSVDGAEAPSTPILQAGLYRYDDRVTAINRPSSEDEWAVLDEASLRELLRGTNASFFDQTAAESETPLLREIWKVFLALALIFLIVEAILTLQPKLVPVKALS